MAKESERTDPNTAVNPMAYQQGDDRVSSSASTGGAGTFFEQHVDAYWLAQLLVRGIPPILLDCVVAEVHLQTEHLGWHTDDFLIIGQKESGDRRKLAGQVKRSFTVSATDDECRKAVQDFWKDFRSDERFSPADDRFALVTLRGTNVLLEDFARLLECSRAARDGAEFERRVTTQGFISAKAIKYCSEIRKIVGEVEGRIVSTAETWQFLRVLHILSLDLNTGTRQTEAMTKTLLTYTAGEQDAIGAAEATWNALLQEVSEGMPKARSYYRDKLPTALLRRHSQLGGNEQRVLLSLRNHSAIILGGIRSTIGSDFHLERTHLVQRVLNELRASQVVLVSGAAGRGKSVIASEAIGLLAGQHFAFSFRAEEFAHPHLDEALQNSQIPSNGAMLAAILAGQDRKILLVESVERLLEKPTRDAFTDLLALVAADENWRLVLTCRDYSLDLVRACFLRHAKVSHSVVMVPPLSDEELGEVKDALPMLNRPLADPATRQVLRNPYILDKALQVRWSQEQHLPQSQWEFRSLVWRDVVRANHHIAGGMPRRREEAFVEIALRRARSLAMYAHCDDFDPEVINGLLHDSLLVSSQQSGVLAAPADDVLEDWAILQWIGQQHAIHSGSLQELCAAIGAHPAVRRTYRKWLVELAERDPEGASGLFQAAMHAEELPAHCCDDTLVSLLRSPSSVAVLERQRSALLANDKHLLRRIIHLLRVACTTTPDWLQTPAATHGSLLNVPEGPAWEYVLSLIQAELQSFAQKDYSLLLGFVEDWACGVSWKTPYPAGAAAAAAIAHWLLPILDGHQMEDQRKRALQVIAKLPNSDQDRFAALLRGGRAPGRRNRETEEFQEIIFEDLDGTPAARDMPELVVSVAKDYLLCSEADLRGERDYGFAPGRLQALFGIREQRSHGFFPASAYRGPFLSLLLHHRQQGLDLVIDVFNHSAEWYAHPKVQAEYVEPPEEITLTFADGTSQKQWCNARLWNLYRGTSVGPHVLQSLLMALERWLLELAEASPKGLDALLVDILRRSSSAALTAVVASVATAFPHASGEALLVLLRSPTCIQLDRQRLASEHQTPSTVSALMPQFDARDRIHNVDRKRADGLAHRHHDLEVAIVNLQLGPLAPRVQEILDQHRAGMPPVEEQDEGDRIWRLALHRMDLRQYSISEDVAEPPAPPEKDTVNQDGREHIRVDLNEPEADVKEMVDQSAAQHEQMSAELGLLMWGLKVFSHEEDGTTDPSKWRQMLQDARAPDGDDGHSGEHSFCRAGRGFVAAVCVRDHWGEMLADEHAWCVDVVCSEVERQWDNWDQFERVQQNAMSADRPCAWAMPLLLGKTLSGDQASRVQSTLAIALTHPVREVRKYAASGVGMHLWAVDRDLTLRCVNALGEQATLVQQAVEADRSRPYEERRTIDAIEAEVAASLRDRFLSADAIAVDAYQAMDPTTWFGAEANTHIVAILGRVPTEPAAVAAFERLAKTLVKWWDLDDDRRQNRHQERPERNPQVESALTRLLEDFLLRTPTADATRIAQPIVEAIDRHPDKVDLVLLGLIGAEDRQPNTPQFWLLWEQFADGVRRAAWLAGIDKEYSRGHKMVSAAFLGTWWKDGVRHWRSLEGHAEHLHALFRDLPARSTVLDAYMRFLYHVGEQSLPQAFILIAERLREGDPAKMLRKGNTVFLLEVLLQGYAYGKPMELKRQVDLREAVLFLLNVLVDNGSSAAFRVRDDFVTPIPVA